MPVGRTNRRDFIAALGGAAAWPVVARAVDSGDHEEYLGFPFTF